MFMYCQVMLVSKLIIKQTHTDTLKLNDLKSYRVLSELNTARIDDNRNVITFILTVAEGELDFTGQVLSQVVTHHAVVTSCV